MTNPLPKHVKIGSIWQDIVYENLPMMCYKCGRIGHREPQCPEAMAELTNPPPQELEQRQPTTLPLDPNHVSTPWKTVHTRRTCARGRPNNNLPTRKPEQADSLSPNHPRGPARVMLEQATCSPQRETVIRQGCELEHGDSWGNAWRGGSTGRITPKGTAT